jgi:hypothetical protein
MKQTEITNATLEHKIYGTGFVLKIKNCTEGKNAGAKMFYVQFNSVTCWISDDDLNIVELKNLHLQEY